MFRWAILLCVPVVAQECLAGSLVQTKRSIAKSKVQLVHLTRHDAPWVLEGPAHFNPHHYVAKVSELKPARNSSALPGLALALTLLSVVALLGLSLREKEPKAFAGGHGSEGLSTWDATVATFSGIVGVGVLSMPYAISRGGLVIAPLILVVVGCSAYTAHLLVWAFQELQQRSPLAGGLRPLGDEGMSGSSPFDGRALCGESKFSWGFVMEAAFGPKIRTATNLFIFLETWGYLLSYTVGAAMNISQCIGEPNSETWAVLLSVAFAYALSIPRNLTKLHGVSTCVYIACLAMVCLSGLLLPERGSLSELSAFDGHGLFSVAGILVFSPAAHAFFPDIQRRMQRPQNYPLCLKGAYSAAAALYLSVGLAGCLLFGHAVKPSAIQNVGWTRDFRPLPHMHWMAAASAAGMAIRLLVMQAYVLPTLTSSLCGVTGCSSQGVLLTSILAASAGAAACFAQQLTVLLNCIGGAICANIAFTMPVLCYWKLSRQTRTLPWFEQLGLALLFLMGACFSMLGVFSFTWMRTM
ncbi:unnamed protein product [Effrenium voratum]|nr:unnamed protein product [Effrenium voratum]